MIRDYLRAAWNFWTRDPRYFKTRRAAMRLFAPGFTAVSIYLSVLGYWTLGGMLGALAIFALWRWRKLGQMIEAARQEEGSTL